MSKGRTYEFRKEAVPIARTSRLSRRKVADDLAVGFSTLNKWVSAHRGTDVVSAEDGDLAGENERLRREVRPALPPAVTAAPPPALGAPVPGFSQIPELDVRASAGHGAFHEGDEEIKAVWMFPDAVIRHELRARSANLRMITIDGDSMEPLLASGDRVLVDTAQRVPAPPGIFVIWDGLGIVAKRIEHIPTAEPSRIVIKSVNPLYNEYERPTEEVNIIGRVIWAGKKL